MPMAGGLTYITNKGFIDLDLAGEFVVLALLVC